MRLSKTIVGLIIGLIVLSLAGLVVLQVLLLQNARELKEQTFNHNVANVMNAVSEMLETHEIAVAAYAVAGDSAGFYSLDVTTRIPDIKCKDSVPQRIMIIASDSITADGEKILPGFPSSLPIESLDDDSDYIKILHRSDTELVLPDSIEQDSIGYIIKIQMSSDSSRIDFVERVIKKLWIAGDEPDKNRLDSVLIDSVLKTALTEADIDLDYAYAVKDNINDSIYFVNQSEYINELEQSEFKKRLYPYDLLTSEIDLMLYFPNRDVYLWRQISPVVVSTIIFMLIIVFCFAYTIRTILIQRRNANLMIDFVNNMTHEFKTPISTVALACEAIMRPDMISNNEKVTRYSKMIRDENLRMRRQADKILQMAALEESDFELKFSQVDIHEITTEAVGNIHLQIENRGGEITFTPDATNFTINADRVHLSNIIFNLLDNAIKYSQDKPTITISTQNEGDRIVIRVTDKGIGIRDEDIKNVFKKYYRVSTGNVHDVKGFGLGLSYVKLMVEAHDGTIYIISKFGVGTTVEIYFPLTEKTS